MSIATRDRLRRHEARQVRASTIESFHDQMASQGIRRAFIVSENGELTLSHPQLLQPIRSFFELSHDFADHEGVFIGREDGVETLFLAAVHDTRRGLAQGGLRFQHYASLADLITDGLRLAQGMTRKNALAGLWWGGGKGIVARSKALSSAAYAVEGSDERLTLFRAYGRFVASLGGVYYTAEDIGTKTSDLNAILGANRFTTCVGSELGGSGNPSPYTARGVLRAMQAGWRFLTGSDDLGGVHVAVQGAGNVGLRLIEDLHEAGAQLTVTDIDRAALEQLASRLTGIRLVDSDEIFDVDADVFAPCAIGAQVNSRTIPRLKFRLICGAANNILEEPADADRLRQRGIVYVPDFVCNRMGITNCADEWQGYLPDDVRLAAERVYPDTLRVLKHARSRMLTSATAAEQLADIASAELNPLIAHRGRRLIDRLVSAHRNRRVPHGRGPSKQIFDFAIEEPALRICWEHERKPKATPAGGLTIAAAPISAAARPDFATLLTPLLADIRARSLDLESRDHRPLIVGSDPGGLALQLAVERSLPFDREEIGRSRFSELCRDRFRSNDHAIREELHGIGIDFDPAAWLDPLAEPNRGVADTLLGELGKSGIVAREEHLTYYDPVAQTVLVEPDVCRDRVELLSSFEIDFETANGEKIVTHTFYPELVAGAEAVAVLAGGRYHHLDGSSVADPFRDGETLPVIAIAKLGTEAKFLVPSHDRSDRRLAAEHSLDHHRVVIDSRGLIRLPGQPPLSAEEARHLVGRLLGERMRTREGSWYVDTFRSRRSATLLHLGPARNLFIHLEESAVSLRRLIDDGAVTFSHDRWRARLLSALDDLQPWCVSRQYWWGQRSPRRKNEVLSVWFTLVGWTLTAMDWPNDSATPLDEIVASSELLERWILPSLLVALQLSGKPAFRHIVIHEPLHIIERRLEERSDRGVANGLENCGDQHFADEERFVTRFVRRSLRRRPGASIEPQTLIRRFGADAFRLGCVLGLSGRELGATLNESHLRRARRSLRRLDAKLSGLLKLENTADRSFADEWLRARATVWQADARNSYSNHDYGAAARSLCAAIDDLSRFAAAISPKGTVHEHTLWTVLVSMARAFAPICPFVFDHLKRRARGHSNKVEDAAIEVGDHSWLVELVELVEACAKRGHSISLTSPHRSTRAFLDTSLGELAALARGANSNISVGPDPRPGQSHIIGPCVLSEVSANDPAGPPSRLHEHPHADPDAVTWYHQWLTSIGPSQP